MPNTRRSETRPIVRPSFPKFKQRKVRKPQVKKLVVPVEKEVRKPVAATKVKPPQFHIDLMKKKVMSDNPTN